jgi:hypothetical protein
MKTFTFALYANIPPYAFFSIYLASLPTISFHSFSFLLFLSRYPFLSYHFKIAFPFFTLL